MNYVAWAKLIAVVGGLTIGGAVITSTVKKGMKNAQLAQEYKRLDSMTAMSLNKQLKKDLAEFKRNRRR